MPRIEVGRILVGDGSVDLQGFSSLAFFKVELAEGQIVRDRAAQKAPLRVEITQMPVDFIPFRIDFEDFLVGGDGLHRGPFSAERRSSLQIGRDRFI